MWSDYDNLKMQHSKIQRTFLSSNQRHSNGNPYGRNLANLFMGKFETDLLNDYRNKYNKSPGI